MWTEPNRLVDRFEASLEFAAAPHYEAYMPIGVHETRIQIKRPSILGDRVFEAKLGLKRVRFSEVSGRVVWIECERFRHQFARPVRSFSADLNSRGRAKAKM